MLFNKNGDNLIQQFGNVCFIFSLMLIKLWRKNREDKNIFYEYMINMYISFLNFIRFN